MYLKHQGMSTAQVAIMVMLVMVELQHQHRHRWSGPAKLSKVFVKKKLQQSNKSKFSLLWSFGKNTFLVFIANFYVPFFSSFPSIILISPFPHAGCHGACPSLHTLSMPLYTCGLVGPTATYTSPSSMPISPPHSCSNLTTPCTLFTPPPAYLLQNSCLGCRGPLAP